MHLEVHVPKSFKTGFGSSVLRSSLKEENHAPHTAQPLVSVSEMWHCEGWATGQPIREMKYVFITFFYLSKLTH